MKIDVHGCAPGDQFESLDEAAEDFGRNYNSTSIEQNREYITLFYSININEQHEFLFFKWTTTVTVYSYTEPVAGTIDSSAISAYEIPDGTTLVAYGHTHGAYDPTYESEKYSKSDIDSAYQFGIYAYLATPGGKLFCFDGTDGSFSYKNIDNKIRQLPCSMQKDPNYPSFFALFIYKINEIKRALELLE